MRERRTMRRENEKGEEKIEHGGEKEMEMRHKILAAILFSQTVYSRLDSEFQDYIDKLELWCYYWGLYVLIFVAIVILVSCVFSCGAIYQEIVQLLQLVSTEGAPSGIS
ncbi:hypothetical protein M8J77_021128 [Diaphorina citri]|nr:hypothetical protein M8J77_021128 [Diaphorina citri]